MLMSQTWLLAEIWNLKLNTEFHIEIWTGF